MGIRDDADKARRRLHARDRALLNALADSYGDAHQAVKAEARKVAKRIDEARRRGEQVSEAWLIREQALDRLEQAARGRVQAFAKVAEQTISDATVAELAAAKGDTARILAASLPAGAVRAGAIAAVDRIVAAGGPSGRLRLVLAALPEDAARRVRSELIRAVVLGRNPRDTARQITDALGGNFTRALTIARTETIGAYRDASIDGYRASGVVQEWAWDATLDATTCPVCWAMHGTTHPLDEGFDSHPNCRCSPVPVTRPWGDLGVRGVRETSFQPVLGQERFDKLPASRQRVILGPGKYAAYQDGRFQLSDLVASTVHPVYGRGLRERALRDL